MFQNVLSVFPWELADCGSWIFMGISYDCHYGQLPRISNMFMLKLLYKPIILDAVLLPMVPGRRSSKIWSWWVVATRTSMCCGCWAWSPCLGFGWPWSPGSLGFFQTMPRLFPEKLGMSEFLWIFCSVPNKWWYNWRYPAHDPYVRRLMQWNITSRYCILLWGTWILGLDWETFISMALWINRKNKTDSCWNRYMDIAWYCPILLHWWKDWRAWFSL